MTTVMLMSVLVAFSIEVDGADESEGWAEVSDYNDIKDAIRDGKNIKLMTGISIVEDTDFGSVNIDANGYYILVKNGAEVKGTGTIKGYSTHDSRNHPVSVQNGTLDGFTFIDNVKVSISIDPLQGPSTVKNCKLYGEVVVGIYVDLRGPSDAKVTIDNCEFHGTYSEASISLQKLALNGAQQSEAKYIEVSNCDIPSFNIWGNGTADGFNCEPIVIGDGLTFESTNIDTLKLTNSGNSVAEIIVPNGKEIMANTITGNGKIVAQPGSKVLVENISVPVEGEGEVINITDKPTPPVDEDDEYPFIPGHNTSSGKDDTTTYIAVAAATAVVAVLAVLVMAMSKGKL